MKLNKWLYGVTALAMLAACSDKDVAPGGQEEDLNGSVTGADGYLAVEIKLPQEAVTRAGDYQDGNKNDFFDDGLENEYAVNNAMIVIFKGTSETTATFQKAVDLQKPFFTNTPLDDQITSSYVAAVPVKQLGTSSTDHYYGLVILNRNPSSTNVQSGANGYDTDVKIANQPLVANTTKLSDILDYTTGTTGDEFITDNGFFMINAPLSSAKVSTSSSASDIHYLADLGNQTYTTIEDAKKFLKNCIYVERAVAKVTSQVKNSAYQLNFYDKDGNDISSSLNVSAEVKYGLTNTNKKSYVLRNVETANLGSHFSWSHASTKNNRLRMIGANPMPGLDSPFHGETDSGEDPSIYWYRTYWCYDPNYEKNAFDIPTEGEYTTEFKVLKNPTELKDLSNPLYCMENTFDVARQNNGNSTMVVFEVNYTVTKPASSEDANDGVSYDNLYIRNGDTSKIYVTVEAATWAERSVIIKDKDIQNALTEALNLSDKTSFADKDGVVKNAEQYLEFEVGKDDHNLLQFKSISIKQGCGISDAGIAKFNTLIGGATTVGSIQNKLLANVNYLGDVTEYTGGVSYYSIPVMHFGKYYCPWGTEVEGADEIYGTETKDVYNGGTAFGTNVDHAKDYLGRYGMVRNNWYDLAITQLKYLGSPEIPEINLTLSDDNKENKRYIGVEIHVLSWAKRTQEVKF